MATATEATAVAWSMPAALAEDTLQRVQPAKPLSLKRNAVWTTIGNGTYAASQWTQIALIAHLGTSADVGHYALAMAVCAPVFMLFNLQLRQIQAVDSTRKHSFAEYLGLRLLSSAIALAAVCVLACFSSRASSAAALTVLVGLFKGIESVSDIYQGLLQQHERMDYVGRSMLLKSVLILSAFTGVYYCTKSLVFAASAMVCAQAAGCLVYDIRASYQTVWGRSSNDWLAIVRVMCRATFSPAVLKKLAVRALPLGIAMMLISVYGNLPRFVLNKYVGAAGVGVFAAITYMSMAGGLLVTAVGTAMAPRLSQYALTNHRAYKQLLGQTCVVCRIFGRPWSRRQPACLGAIFWSCCMGRSMRVMRMFLFGL